LLKVRQSLHGIS